MKTITTKQAQIAEIKSHLEAERTNSCITCRLLCVDIEKLLKMLELEMSLRDGDLMVIDAQAAKLKALESDE